MVVGGIIEYENESLVGIDFISEPFEKLNHRFSADFGGELSVDGVIVPVVSANDTATFVGLAVSGGRDAALLAPFLPALAQGRIQTQACFVHKQELTIGVERPLFSSSSNA